MYVYMKGMNALYYAFDKHCLSDALPPILDSFLLSLSSCPM